MFNSDRAFKVFFAIVYSSYMIFKECLKATARAYECQSMLQGPRYYHLDMNQP